MSRPIRVIHFGLGAIGMACVRLALTKKSLRVVGAVDADPTKAGLDLGELLGLRRRLGVRVESKLPSRLRADAVVLATGSYFLQILPQLEQIARAKLHCVSSCEELLFPQYRHARLTTRLDRLAKKHCVAVVGTGVNPGFVMDTLALLMTGVCQRVDSIEVVRILDLAHRRAQLQLKVGLGISPAKFRQRAADGTLGHVGLIESVAFLADALGWRLDHITQHLEPIVAEREMATKFVRIRCGQVAGMHQIARGSWHGMDRIRLDLQMRVAPDRPRDEILLEGEPRVRLLLPGGIHGDQATAAVLLNVLPSLLAAKPGLRTMRELTAPHVIG